MRVLNPNPSERAANLKLGVGLQYQLQPSLLLRAEAERYVVNDAVGNRGDVNVFSMSLVVPFGRAPTSAPRAAVPAYVAPAPVPAPVITAAPAAPPAAVVAAAPPPPVVVPERRSVSFAADSLFSFDQSTIRPAGRAALDTLARDLQGTRFDVIKVEGHTDRLGFPAYNQALSVRRAEAVKAYLVDTGHIAAAKIAAVGRGESAPVTQPGDCKGSKPSAALIACLQADRRVVVEVTGTR